MRTATPCATAATFAFISALAFLPASAEEAPLGFEVATAAVACERLTGSPRDGDAPLPVLIDVDPAALEQPVDFDAMLSCAQERRLSVVARILPPLEWQRAADPYTAIEGWLSRLESFLLTRHQRVRRFELGLRPEASFEPDAYVFLVEKVSTIIRSFDAQAVVAVGALSDAAGEWFERIEPRRLHPYVDALALADPVDLSVWMPRLARDYPASRVWLHAEAPADPAGRDPAALLLRYHEARAAGVETCFVPWGEGEPAAAIALNLTLAMPSRFVPGGEAPSGTLGFADPMSPERALVRMRAWTAPLTVGGDPVRDVRALDLANGAQLAAWALPPRRDEAAAIDVAPPPAGPVLVRYIVMKGPRIVSETVGVTDEYQMSAEEIIARERAFEAAQARTLDHYQARASISYHYRAETLGESIDVASVNRFFWKGGVGEYEETELYVNGAKWKGKPPALPFIQAEKVKEVPLEIRLDESYSYRLKGKETVARRPAWVLAFEPVSASGSFYSGEVWIDAQTFARLRIRLVQQGLKEPITSNSDLIDYEQVPGGGDPAVLYWLPARAYRQMVFTVLGRVVAAERRVTYEDFAINAPEFETGREAAFASGRPILRDEPSGYSYVIKDGDTFRSVQTESLRNVAFGGRVGIDSNFHVGTPSGGVNYFDFNWRGTGTQLNATFAGVLLDVAWTDPRLGQSSWERTLGGRLVGPSEKFRRTDLTGSVDVEEVRLHEQRGLASLSRPITPFQKMVLQADVIYDSYEIGLADNQSDPQVPGDPNTRVRLPDFVPPPAGTIGLATGRWNYHRRGYLIDLWASRGHRFRWDDWGLPVLVDPNDKTGPTHLVGGRADDTEFARWGATLLKSIYPTKLQTVSFGMSLFDGDHLDRFSRYRIGDFRNTRVRGFNSRDLTFDRAAVAQLNYKFTLVRGGASVELGVERAAFENEEDFGGWEVVAGGGAALSIQGPWGTLLSFRGSFGLASSIDKVDSSGAGLSIVMIKTMDHWPRWRKRGP